jgi:pimeloyl-ACP methyl ester carboxylesterase
MSRPAFIPALAGLVTVAALAATSASAAGAGLAFTPCATAAAFSCATLPVPLDRTGALSGTVALNLERKLAGATPSHTAVIGLAGGPGQAAVPLGEFIAQAIAPALSSRDLLVFDQRGTGASDPLKCAALGSGAIQQALGALIARCAYELGPARGAFTTAESVADIEALRQAAGYEKLVLYGTSYGTKVALEYAERYPAHVEALVLDSTETASGPEPFHISTFKAMTPALRELCAHGACTGVTGDPVGDLARLIAALTRHPLHGRVYDRTGRPVGLSLTGAAVYELLLAGDENPVLRAAMPAALHAAVHHDASPLLRLAALVGGASSSPEENGGVDEVLLVDTSCEETPFPWQRAATAATREVETEAALNALPTRDFYPFDAEAALLFQTIPLCIAWPDAAPAPPAQAPLPNVPTLILSGTQDLRTPTEDALQVAAQIPDAQVVKVPYTGHSVIGSDLSGCAQHALARFFTAIPVGSCPAAPNRFPTSTLAPLSIASLPATRGVPAANGRAVTAVVQTIRDLRRIVLLVALGEGKIPVGARFGGLRGGDARVTKSAVVLSRLSYVPGVTLDGALPNDLLLKDRGGAGTLRVGGPATAGGQIRIAAGGRVEGVLAGQRFATRLTAKAVAGRAAHAGATAEWPTPIGPLPPSALTRPR